MTTDDYFAAHQPVRQVFHRFSPVFMEQHTTKYYKETFAIYQSFLIVFHSVLQKTYFSDTFISDTKRSAPSAITDSHRSFFFVLTTDKEVLNGCNRLKHESLYVSFLIIPMLFLFALFLPMSGELWKSAKSVSRTRIQDLRRHL